MTLQNAAAAGFLDERTGFRAEKLTVALLTNAKNVPLTEAHALIEAVAYDIDYHGWEVRVSWSQDDPYEYEIAMRRPLLDSNDRTSIWPGTTKSVAYIGSLVSREHVENDALGRIWDAISKAEDHERGEWFLFRGARPFLPAHDPDPARPGFLRTDTPALLPRSAWPATRPSGAGTVGA